jgi:hypothetical protein
MKINTKLGTIVQNNSNSWDSSICWSMFVLKIVENKLNPTIETIKIKIVRVWSWKKINCSIKGEERISIYTPAVTIVAA